ncbi:MAG: hypothetical protein ACSW8B_02380 [bacterium]
MHNARYPKNDTNISEFVKIFKRNADIDYSILFHEQYKSVQNIYLQYAAETDPDVKKALLKIIIAKYEELLSYISQGARYDRKEIKKLLKQAQEELKELTR